MANKIVDTRELTMRLFGTTVRNQVQMRCNRYLASERLDLDHLGDTVATRIIIHAALKDVAEAIPLEPDQRRLALELGRL